MAMMMRVSTFVETKPEGDMKMKNGRTLYPDSATIELSVEANPGRRGTTAHQCFEIARRSQDIADYRESGGKLPYLYWLKGRGKLEIVV